ncbi:MAG: hypothetical protein DSO07_09020, partial [Thermoproteota archaeon]
KQSSEGIPVAIVRGYKWRECECKLREAIPSINLIKAARLTARRTARILGIRKIIRNLLC